MKLAELLDKLDYAEFYGDKDTEISGLCTDSQKVREGDLFFCYKGEKFDSHDFAEDAVKSGAAAIICERKLGCGGAQIIVKARALSARWE